jgi:DNA repair exonuclease SbcCD nuclease subunit
LEVLVRDGVDVWTQPGIKQSEADGRWSGYVPYRKDPEEQMAALQGVREALAEEHADFPVIFGHFGVRGATMNNTKVDQEGLEVPSWTDKVLLVLGHYHGFQHLPPAGISSVVYVGSVFQHSYGEVGNDTGVVQLRWSEKTGWNMDHVPLGVGPKHHIVRWDVVAHDTPPPLPSSTEGDKVRLDILAPPSLIGSDLIKTIKAAGYEAAQVNVQPAPEKREHRFNMQVGEDLLQAAERFVALRLEEQIEPSEHPLCLKLYELAGEL